MICIYYDDYSMYIGGGYGRGGGFGGGYGYGSKHSHFYITYTSIISWIYYFRTSNGVLKATVKYVSKLETNFNTIFLILFYILQSKSKPEASPKV